MHTCPVSSSARIPRSHSYFPCREVHVSDLIQAHEGNADTNPAAPNKIHWGKYNMIGKFISNTTQCQVQCRTTTDYDFPERPRVRELLQREKLMDEEVRVFFGMKKLDLTLFVNAATKIANFATRY
jgi:hypothetical protein